jgi:hypothetical protein
MHRYLFVRPSVLKFDQTMRATSVIFSIFFAAGIAVSCLAQSADPISGRWEGTVEIPGRPVILVVDLASESGHWIGSATVPRFNVKGAPLANLTVSGSQVEFTVQGVLGDPKVKAQLADGALKGEFTLSGNVANFTLRKTGPAQVDLPRKSTRVQRELEGPWNGTIVYTGIPMQVKLTLTNGDDAASANLIFVREKDLPVAVALVRQEDSALTVETGGGRISLEAKFYALANELRGTLQLGGAEIPIVLRKGNAR